MHIRSLSARHFRNLSQISLQFANDLFVLIAPNGTGKTNVLEAIHLLSTGRSIRAEKEADLLEWRQAEPQFARVDGLIDDGEQEHNITIKLQSIPNRTRIKKTITVDDVNKRSTELPSIFPTLFFTPDTLRVIAGSPSRRREFFDQVCSVYSPQYAPALRHYSRALQHRNSILREQKHADSMYALLEPWDDQLARYGAIVIATRQLVTNHCMTVLSTLAPVLHREKQQQTLTYIAHLLNMEESVEQKEIITILLSALKSHRQRDCLLGSTSIGPHRDDWESMLGTFSLRSFGSRGQQRMGSIALLISCHQTISDQLGKPPVLLLDDLFSELDSEHSNLLFTYLSQKKSQTFISATDTAHVPPLVQKQGTVLDIEQILKKE